MFATTISLSLVTDLRDRLPGCTMPKRKQDGSTDDEGESDRVRITAIRLGVRLTSSITL